MPPPHDLEEIREEDPLLVNSRQQDERNWGTFDNVNKPIDMHVDREVQLEFGGPIGVTFMMVFFPTIMYYFWICIEFNDGHLAHPTSFDEIGDWLQEMGRLVTTHAAPNVFSVVTYVSFTVLQFVLAASMPGPIVKGMPVPSLGFKQLDYLCNGVACWYATLAASAILHFTNVLPLSGIIDNFGPIMTVSIITGFAITIAVYVYGVSSGSTHRMSGSIMYDMFMGAVLNPRIGNVDLKIWAEIRIPWVLLFFITVSSALKELESTGNIRPEVLFMVLAHLLYVNACMKGEECIPTTWDIFYEKYARFFFKTIRLAI
ncbi:hypothetical protein PhCBS80983_g00338 [Powellomyces hirtus]|uniref:Delta(24(24(1)))-sterol reductase n=1 Tax=Powellomyces hirtus TaxID=109895 RepID=A0A507EED4_9FUNG|nr:hypothetical protein PhCBS80983_g00338 [Powellomyces hirtus]